MHRRMTKKQAIVANMVDMVTTSAPRLSIGWVKVVEVMLRRVYEAVFVPRQEIKSLERWKSVFAEGCCHRKPSKYESAAHKENHSFNRT